MTEVRPDFLPKFILVTVILLVVSVYFYFVSSFRLGYVPYYGDEYFYFKNSENFYLNNSLEAAFTYSGHGAKILGADAHGPAYPIIYGSISKILGWGRLTIPLVNLGFLCLGLLFLIWKKRESGKIKMLQVLLILGSPITLFYSITYLPELLHIAGGIGLFLFVQRYLINYKLKDFFLLLLYIVILGSIRSTWFFAFFGLIALPGPIQGFAKSLYLVLGLVLAFLYQHFLHEQVPNTFSGLGELIQSQGLWAGLDTVFFNFKRNIYFTFSYTEGHFYTIQKIWIASSILASLVFFRDNKLIQFGLIILCGLMVFNFFLYKNYNWVEFRMYVPMTLFLNLAMISSDTSRIAVLGLLSLNLFSFILILPLQQELAYVRVDQKAQALPESTRIEILNMKSPLVYIDSLVLGSASIITELPLVTGEGEGIRYILPYYSMPMKLPDFILSEKNGQLTVKPVKIRCQ